MIIRNARPTDIEGILVLWNELMLYHIALDPIFEMSDSAEEKFRSFLSHNIDTPFENVVKVAEIDGNIVGYMMGTIKNNPPVFKIIQFGEIMDAYVTARHRHSGIGEELFNDIKNWYIQKGITRIDVNAAAKNTISTEFWQKMGFLPYLNHMYRSLRD